MQVKRILEILRKKRWFLLACAFAATMIVIWFTTRMKMIEPPETIWKLHRMELFSGDTAQAVISELHGFDRAPKDNFVANYVSPDGCGQLYVSFYENNVTASQEMERMSRKIQSGDFPDFSHLRRIEMERIPMVLSQGMRKVHYFFTYRNGLYWFDIDAPVAQFTVREFVRYLRKQ
ncbi:MAG: hypothetical protein WAV76_00225 [Bacteroidota bacterium]